MPPAAPLPAHLPRSRHEHLLRELSLRGSVRASEIAAELGVSEVTIRRDIIRLERDGQLARVHGGAISAAETTRPRPARTPVGLVLPGPGSHFPAVTRGAGEAASALHARLMMASTDYRVATERRQVRQLLDLGIEGLLIAPTLRDRTPAELLEELGAVPVPVVLLERSLEGTVVLADHDGVRTDHARGTLMALEHLRTQGHERIGLAVLDRTPTAAPVREGFLRACGQLDLDPPPIRSLPKDDGGRVDPVDAALAELLADSLARGVRALVVHTDHYAARLVEIALDQGIRVPEDLAVIAYDDEFAEHCIVPLTAVSPPGREIGRLALHTVFDRIRTGPGEAAGPPRHVQVSPQLIVRSSTLSVGAEAGAAVAEPPSAGATSTR
ncbi:substrate-binding domain-containing protein [Brachybacterium sp. J144]|uniref:substrate-binding domain-containing protein n=1 Tax=Brachybacterium sp. J144 TaxID=3116487 RepID=UPI002E779BF7|nr:substrate-binding domain-containing protein [Brachybacterium sp. J144]MEE1650612.1 substrate-binding domain-containing protein [Brachybacterium sp. J144]